MIAMLNFATLAVVAIFATAAALAFDWMLLRAMFLLMRPAAVRGVPGPANLARGTGQIARAYAPRR